MNIEAVIFDLDGVIVATDELHFYSWQKLADEEGIDFNDAIYENMRGKSRSEGLNALLKRSEHFYSDQEKLMLANRKNSYFLQYLSSLSFKDVLPGVIELLDKLKLAGINLAIGSSSKNALITLEKIGLLNYFDVIVDGTDVLEGKPNPQIFQIVSDKLRVPPHKCLVIEDSLAGVEAAVALGMPVVGLGNAAKYEVVSLPVESLTNIKIETILK